MEKDKMIARLQDIITTIAKPVTAGELADKLLQEYAHLDIGLRCKAKVYFSAKRVCMIAEQMGYELSGSPDCYARGVEIRERC